MKNTFEKDIKITFVWNIDKSPASEAEMYEKLFNVLNKFNFDYMNTVCEISKEGNEIFSIKLVTDLPKYKTIVIKQEDRELQNAFDKAKQNLQSEVSKVKSIKRDY